MTVRQIIEERERKNFSPRAKLSSATQGRLKGKELCDFRPAFQHDRDKILYSKSFRRLKHKTQVFLSPFGDHYRTRLTHTLEVAQIARSIARYLRVNEDLAEAISLGHDLGHTPFGHAGEEILNRLYPEGFHHVGQSLRVVDVLEKEGQGLNLTYEVRDGIVKHSKGKGPILSDNDRGRAETLEGQIVRVSDIIAYLNHDFDDAVRAGVLTLNDLPPKIAKVLGKSSSQRISHLIGDIVRETEKTDELVVKISKEVEEAVLDFREFLYEKVYENKIVHSEFIKATKVLEELYNYYLAHIVELYEEVPFLNGKGSAERVVCDFLAGMTDRYALNRYKFLFLPQRWSR